MMTLLTKTSQSIVEKTPFRLSYSPNKHLTAAPIRHLKKQAPDFPITPEYLKWQSLTNGSIPEADVIFFFQFTINPYLK